MARVCQITGKAPMVGNNVSHANNKTKRRFLPNLQQRRFWVESENRWVNLRLTNAALRTIDKKGIDAVLTELRARGEHDVDALLVDEPEAGARKAHLHPAVLALDPEPAVLQVGQETTLGFIVGVGNVVPNHGLLARNDTYASHDAAPELRVNRWG